MKNRTVILILCFAAILAGYLLLGRGYLSARDDNNAMSASISTAMLELASLPPADTTIEQRTEEARQMLTDARNVLPETINSSVFINDLLKNAASNNVSAIPLTTMPWQTITINATEITGFELIVRFTGSYSNLQRFMDSLSQQYPSLRYNSISLEHAPDGEETPANKVTAEVNMTCYSQYHTAAGGERVP